MEADGVFAMIRWLGNPFHSYVACGRFTCKTPEIAKSATPRFDATKFYAAINERRKSMGLTWSELALQIPQTSPAMLTRLAHGGRMSVQLVASLSCWLGIAPETFVYFSHH